MLAALRLEDAHLGGCASMEAFVPCVYVSLLIDFDGHGCESTIGTTWAVNVG